MVFGNVQGLEEIMVTETSAYLYLPNEERISAHTDRSMIAKLGDGTDSLYRTLADKYYELYSKAVRHPESQTSVEEACTDEDDAQDLSITDIVRFPGSLIAIFREVQLVRQCRESTERLKINLAFATLRSFESPNQEMSERFRGILELAEIVATKIAKRQVLLT